MEVYKRFFQRRCTNGGVQTEVYKRRCTNRGVQTEVYKPRGTNGGVQGGPNLTEMFRMAITL